MIGLICYVCLRCECHGNAKRARYIPRNATNNGTCVCECEPTTFTEGEKVRISRLPVVVYYFKRNFE